MGEADGVGNGVWDGKGVGEGDGGEVEGEGELLGVVGVGELVGEIEGDGEGEGPAGTKLKPSNVWISKIKSNNITIYLWMFLINREDFLLKNLSIKPVIITINTMK